MDLKDFAQMLNGMEYGNGISKESREIAKESNIVIIYGESDDLVELDGVVQRDEAGGFGDFEIFLSPKGFLENPCDNSECPYFEKEKDSAPMVRCLWDRDGYSWVYETDIPHETFDIMEDGEKYCRGIVFHGCHIGINKEA